MIRISKQTIGYAVFTIMAIAVFLYVQFPEETVRNYAQYTVNRLLPGQRLSIGRLRPSFPMGIRMTSVSLSHRDLTVAELDPVILSPKLLSLAGSRPAVTFRGELCGGTISGIATLDRRENPGVINVNTHFSDVQIRGMTLLQTMSENTVAGLLSGTAEYAGNVSEGSGSAAIALTEVRVALAQPLFSITELSFSNVDAKAELRNRETLQITACTLKGEQVGGNLSGAITLKNPVRLSRLDITGTLRPHPSFIAKLGQMVAAIFKNRRTGGDFPFRLTGTIEQPDFALN